MSKSVIPSVTIVIPNWNGVYLMKKHLRNVIRASPGAEIVVADDMSTDGSIEYLKEEFPEVLVVKRSKREGFGANVDSGVVAASGEIVLLLNTDVEPEKGYLQPLLTHFADPDVFAVGCLEKSVEKSGVVLRGRGIGRWHKGFYIHSKGEVNMSDTTWVSGGSGAFRKTMWNKLGGMDVLFNPFYWEDIDLSYRARKAGWKTIFERKSIVYHYHEEGKIKREFTPDDVTRIVYRNQFIFIWKNLTDWRIAVEHSVWTPIRLIQALIRGDLLMLQGYLHALMKLPEITAKRFKQHSVFIKRDQELNVYA